MNMYPKLACFAVLFVTCEIISAQDSNSPADSEYSIIPLGKEQNVSPPPVEQELIALDIQSNVPAESISDSSDTDLNSRPNRQVPNTVPADNVVPSLPVIAQNDLPDTSGLGGNQNNIPLANLLSALINLANRGNAGNAGMQGGNVGNAGMQGGNVGNLGNLGNNGNAGSPLGNTGNASLPNLPLNPLGLNNNDLNMERPCHISLEECIKEYFATHAHCKPSKGQVPDPLVRPISTTFITRVNLTLTAFDPVYTGLNGGIIEEFYVNKETDKLVIAIQFKNFTFYAKNTYYIFHRRAKEPVVHVDYLFANIRSMATTTVIPVIDDLQLDKSETRAFIDDINPSFGVGPKAFVSSDPDVVARYPELLRNVPQDIQEFFLTEAAFIAATYIQNRICDFGLQIL